MTYTFFQILDGLERLPVVQTAVKFELKAFGKINHGEVWKY